MSLWVICESEHRAKNILMLFGEKGSGSIELNYVNDRVHVISKTVTNGNDQSHVIFAETISSVTSQTSRTNPTYDRTYFRNKTLDQYPNLYREFSSENFDYYKITNEKLCPLCKLGHDDEESIEGRYKAGSYFIKCEQREIEITAYSQSSL
ncbi:hypothetical protein RhiirC2_863716 [Rhizophagus irregularis]|uniref:Uncharacterized protein n=1 Tax=Rhizophagus irregularis TaxID=588596 RepID=A0A2N1NLD1_9GLOM|nr:hypothetical protein RhiirC2_863716 [Rhizophagus irregularis]